MHKSSKKHSMHVQGRVVLFRPDCNAQRMHEGAERLSMVPPPEDLFLDAVKQVGGVAGSLSGRQCHGLAFEGW
jgi:branched-subunit amino acid aminotransferase/4-amino-4-deoxychorismate lyase